jgi:hypothetical protein
MKKETLQEKLNALLGLTETAKVIKEKATGRVVGVTEEEIQEFREIQGLIYFLQAPQLFTPKVCPNCNTPFVVSRKQVAFCSYLCIAEDLRKKGLEWRKGNDIELLVQDPQVYDGNEPLWIREPLLQRIQEMVTSLLNRPDIAQASEDRTKLTLELTLSSTSKEPELSSLTDSTDASQILPGEITSPISEKRVSFS